MTKQIANTTLEQIEAEVEALKLKHADVAPYLAGARHRENIKHGLNAMWRGIVAAGKYSRAIAAGAPETDAEKLVRLQKELTELRRLG